MHPDIRTIVITAMLSRSISQRGLAAKSKVPQPSIARWLSGRRDITTATLERIMDAIGLTIQTDPRTDPASAKRPPAKRV